MRDTMRDVIPASAAARLFLICALALIGAFVRPGVPASEAATIVACAAPDLDAAIVTPSARDGVLREERAGGVCAAPQPASCSSRPAAAAAFEPACSRSARRMRRNPAAPRAPRDRAHAARGPPPPGA
jgi:hypothetical protein